MNLQGNVKVIVETHNSNKGSVKNFQERYVFDIRGNLNSKISWDINGKESEKETYKYDEFNKIIYKEAVYKNENYGYYEDYTYDGISDNYFSIKVALDGISLLNKFYKSNDNIKEVITYVLKERKDHVDEDVLLEHTFFIYNKNNQLKERIVKNSENEIAVRFYFEYDNYNNVIQIIKESGSKRFKETFDYTKKDKQGNWVENKSLSNNCRYLIGRQIEYF